MAQSAMYMYTRSGTEEIEQPFEKPLILPAPDNQDPAAHAWADARFATDIMAEHGVFFALLMPPEVAQAERTEALRFSESFAEMHQRIASAQPSDQGDLRRFTQEVIEQIKPFIEWKATMGDAQRNGNLRSLVWPLFFDHTRHEAERWTGGSNSWAMASRSSTGRKWPRSGTTSWMSTLGSSGTFSIPTR
jgi:hypothetical protein